MSEKPEEFTGRIIVMSFLFMREDFHQEDGHSSDLDQRKSAKPRRRTSACSSSRMYLSVKDLGLILSHKNIRSLTVQCQRN